MYKKYYRNFKSIEKCYVVEVCEGEGTNDFPVEAVKYVFDNQLRPIGILETKEATALFNQ